MSANIIQKIHNNYSNSFSMEPKKQTVVDRLISERVEEILREKGILPADKHQFKIQRAS